MADGHSPQLGSIVRKQRETAEKGDFKLRKVKQAIKQEMPIYGH
tara:strand:- start:409 stop:540 length:132 start_codon:yes stop_codon:yes gene_type:complete